MENLIVPEKYDTDGPFEDPVVRCCDCSKLIFRGSIKKFGSCPHCGNRRVRNVLAMTGEEMEMLKKKDIDPVFLALFEGVPDDGETL